MPIHRTTLFCYFNIICLFSLNTFGQKVSDNISNIKIDKNGKQPFYFYWNNLFLEKPEIIETFGSNFDEITIDHNYPIRIITNDNDKKQNFGRFSSFVINPSEKLILSRDKFGNSLIFSEQDSIRNNELNFFSEMRNDIGDFEGFSVGLIPLSSSDEEIINNSHHKWKERTQYLNKYKLVKPISNEFESYLINSFYYKKYSDIFFPYFSPYCLRRKTITDSITNLAERDFILNDSFFYLNEYRSAVLSYLVFLSKNTKEINWKELYDLAESKLTGDTREVLLFDILRLSFHENQEMSYPIFQKYILNATHPIFRSYVIKNYQPQFESLKVNTQNLISFFDKKGYLLEDLTKAPYLFSYIDLWASWCGPCRAEMPNSKRLSKVYTSRGVNFVYISIDDNATAWERASKQIGIPDENSYLLPNSKNSILAKQIKLSTIPRYLIIDKNGKIINADAPRPGDLKINSLFNKLLNN